MCVVVWREEDRAPSIIRTGPGARPACASPGAGAVDGKAVVVFVAVEDVIDDAKGPGLDRAPPPPPLPPNPILEAVRGASNETLPGVMISFVLTWTGNNDDTAAAADDDADDDGIGDGMKVC